MNLQTNWVRAGTHIDVEEQIYTIWICGKSHYSFSFLWSDAEKPKGYSTLLLTLGFGDSNQAPWFVFSTLRLRNIIFHCPLSAHPGRKQENVPGIPIKVRRSRLLCIPLCSFGADRATRMHFLSRYSSHHKWEIKLENYVKSQNLQTHISCLKLVGYLVLALALAASTEIKGMWKENIFHPFLL